MPDEPTDVTPDPSPGDETPETPSPETAAPERDAGVTGEEIVGDRPAKNIIAELERKQAQQIAALEQRLMVALQSQARPTVPQEYTDDQLQQLAAAGHADAQRLLQERIAQRTVDTRLGAYQREQMLVAQLQTLTTKYAPQLRDPANPLTQAALAHKSALLAMGHPDTNATRLEALKNAIADTAAEVFSRPAPPRQTQVDGATVRRQAPPVREVKVSDKERDIARRMGIKDPAKALQRFHDRQTKGQSSVSPVVATIVREQGGTA